MAVNGKEKDGDCFVYLVFVVDLFEFKYGIKEYFLDRYVLLN